MPAPREVARLTSMGAKLPIQQVEVSFVGVPPAEGIERASGVSEVQIDVPTVRCLVSGSFQPFLEASQGHEVISLKSTSADSPRRR